MNSMSEAALSATYQIPLVARGALVTGSWKTYPGRRGNISFSSPDCTNQLSRLVLANPASMSDLYSLSFDSILDYLEALGELLSIDRNDDLAQAFALSKMTSGLPDSVLESAYRKIPRLFGREVVKEAADKCVGLPYLEGWVREKLGDGSVVSVRAFGARCVHIIAGNVPLTAAATVVRNAVTRSDALIKTPSNDPLTAVAIAKTMIRMAPDHPLTKHLAVAYWPGGNEEIESRLYHPRNVEKIIAWGGMASIKHIARYIQPGIDLITLDPKFSASIIGKEAFDSKQSLEDVAIRLATDVGVYNQEGCVNARVIYVECDMSSEGMHQLNALGQRVQECFAFLPASISNEPKQSSISRDLEAEVTALQVNEESYRVYGRDIEHGIVVVSQFDDPVDFHERLGNRVANLVPVPSIEAAFRFITAQTQTIGVYPDSLKRRIRDRLAFYGAQCIVSLGYAAQVSLATPQDGLEPVRRMCKWIVEKQCSPESVAPLWQDQ
jgi:acyl-CoA reductase-like NAD-dependent aldehyde dehydrogenase